MPPFAAPQLSREAYGAMPGNEFHALCKNLYGANKSWMNEALDDPAVMSVLVTPDGRILKRSYTNQVLTPEQVRDEANTRGVMVYQLVRPMSFLDISVYFQDTTEPAVLAALERKRDSLTRYKERVETLHAQSGSLDKLTKDFVLGGMREMIPLVGGKRCEEGAIVAYSQDMDVFGGKRLHIASQSENKVHARGMKTSSDRQPGLWVRMERLHRFDDPVLDMFDTYATERPDNWPDLVLYSIAQKNNHSPETS